MTIKEFFQTSWKTTSTGLLIIAGAVIHFVFVCLEGVVTETVIMTTLTAVLAGIGFLMTRDDDKTSTQVGLYGVDAQKKANDEAVK